MSNRKRRRDHSSDGTENPPKHSPPSCILHVPSYSVGSFTCFSSVRERADETLVRLHTIHDRRFAEPLGSKYRMETVCQQFLQLLKVWI